MLIWVWSVHGQEGAAEPCLRAAACMNAASCRWSFWTDTHTLIQVHTLNLSARDFSVNVSVSVMSPLLETRSWTWISWIQPVRREERWTHLASKPWEVRSPETPSTVRTMASPLRILYYQPCLVTAVLTDDIMEFGACSFKPVCIKIVGVLHGSLE